MMEQEAGRGGKVVAGTPGDTAAADSLVVARDACYESRGYTSLEYVSFSVNAGEATALISSDEKVARDVVLAVAGALAPTAGSLMVDGVELARRRSSRGGWSPFSRVGRLPRGTVGLGVVTGFADIEQQETVERVVARELSLWRGSGVDVDVLDYLARHRLATQTDQQVERLDALSRARLSAALAFAPSPRVAALSLIDPFIGPLSVAEGRLVMQELVNLARSASCAVVVSATDAALARVASRAFGMDVAAREAMAREGGAA